MRDSNSRNLLQFDSLVNCCFKPLSQSSLFLFYHLLEKRGISVSTYSNKQSGGSLLTPGLRMQNKKALLTRPVSQLDTLIRSALKVSQSGFESSRNMLPACCFFSAIKYASFWTLFYFAEKRGFEPPGAFTPLP